MNRISQLRKAKGITQEDVSKVLGVNRSAVSKYETGQIALTTDMIDTLSDFFNVTADYLLGRSEVSSEQAVRVPVFGRIPAGIPLEAVDDIIDYEEIPSNWVVGNKEFFALKVAGNSMFPKYLDDDVVIFEKASTCENGADCAVMVNGYDATFKKVLRRENGIVLQPLNAEYEPMFYTDEEIQSLPVTVLGIAKEIRRPV